MVTTTAVASVLSGVYRTSGGWVTVGSAGNSYGPVGFKYLGGSRSTGMLAVVEPTASLELETLVTEDEARVAPQAVASLIGGLRPTVVDGHLVLEYLRPAAVLGVDYVIEASEDLVVWTSLQGQIQETTMRVDALTEKVQAGCLAPMTEAPMRYFRLRVLGNKQ